MEFSYEKYGDHCLGKNVAKNSWPDLTSLKKDFIPLEFEEKEVEIY